MAEKILFVCAWFLIFFFGSALLFGLTMGTPFPTGGGLPIVVGLIGFLLGVFGLLPGTRNADPK